MGLARTNLHGCMSPGLRATSWHPISHEVVRPSILRAGTLGSSLEQPISGLKTTYQVLTEGTGEGVEKGNTVTVQATGYIVKADGSLQPFWSTKSERNRPLRYTAGVGMLIKGWDQGTMGMKKGEVRQLEIPYEEAYGKRGKMGIPAESNMRFEIEVLEIEKDKLDFMKFMPFPGFPGIPGLPGLVCPDFRRKKEEEEA